MADQARTYAQLLQENDQLRSLLSEVLGHFTRRGHPGRPCLRTDWIHIEKVEKWRALAANSGKQEAPGDG